MARDSPTESSRSPRRCARRVTPSTRPTTTTGGCSPRSTRASRTVTRSASPSSRTARSRPPHRCRTTSCTPASRSAPGRRSCSPRRGPVRAAPCSCRAACRPRSSRHRGRRMSRSRCTRPSTIPGSTSTSRRVGGRGGWLTRAVPGLGAPLRRRTSADFDAALAARLEASVLEWLRALERRRARSGLRGVAPAARHPLAVVYSAASAGGEVAKWRTFPGPNARPSCEGRAFAALCSSPLANARSARARSIGAASSGAAGALSVGERAPGL